MVILTVISAAILASGSDLVVAFAGIGGLSGLAALAMVWVNAQRDKRQNKIDSKSVAITEIEKAVPGLGEIIREWQSIVRQLQSDLTAEREAHAETRNELEALRSLHEGGEHV